MASEGSEDRYLFVPGEPLSDEEITPEHPPDPKDGFGLLVDGATEYAVFALSPQGLVSTWNRGAERMKGYRAVEVIGLHFAVFYSEEDRKSGVPNRLLAHALREGRAEAEGWRVRKDGSRFWASVILVPLRDQAGRLRGFSKLTRDESDRRAAEVLQEKTVIVTEQERIAAMLAGSVVRRLFSIGLSLDAARQLASSAPELSKAIEAAASQLDDAVKYLRGAVFNISQAHEVGPAGDDPEMWIG